MWMEGHPIWVHPVCAVVLVELVIGSDMMGGCLGGCPGRAEGAWRCGNAAQHRPGPRHCGSTAVTPAGVSIPHPSWICTGYLLEQTICIQGLDHQMAGIQKAVRLCEKSAPPECPKQQWSLKCTGLRSPHLYSSQHPRLSRQQMRLHTCSRQRSMHQHQQRCLGLTMEHLLM